MILFFNVCEDNNLFSIFNKRPVAVVEQWFWCLFLIFLLKGSEVEFILQGLEL